MRKLALVAMTMALLAATAAAQTEKKAGAPRFTKLDDAKAAATAQNKPILVDFYAEWCTWCKKIDTEVFVQPKVIDFFTQNVILAQIDAEKDTAAAKPYHIMGFPTLVLIDKDGKEIDRIYGYADADSLLVAVDNYRQGINTLDDLLAKAAAKPERSLTYTIAEKYQGKGAVTDAAIWYNKVIEMGDPKDSLSRDCRMAIADSYRRDRKYPEALKAYEAIMAEFAGLSTAMDAEWYRADVYRRSKDTAKAVTAFEEWLAHYPKADTEQVAYTQKLIEKLKNPPPPKAEGK